MIQMGNAEECINPDCPGRKKTKAKKSDSKKEDESKE